MRRWKVVRQLVAAAVALRRPGCTVRVGYLIPFGCAAVSTWTEEAEDDDAESDGDGESYAAFRTTQAAFRNN